MMMGLLEKELQGLLAIERYGRVLYNHAAGQAAERETKA
jgi:hypothetical protein